MSRMGGNVLLRRGEANRAHIPPMPLWLAIVRIAQFVLSLVVMVLVAYSSSVFGAGYYIGYGLSFYIFFWTLFFLGYIIVAPLFMPRIYVYWVHLFLEFKTVILWLATFSLLATEAAGWSIISDYYSAYGYGITYGGQGAIGATKAGAGFGALTWLLFMISFIAFAILSYKHYKANRATTASSTVAGMNQAEKGQVAPDQPLQPVELNEIQPSHQQYVQGTPDFQQPIQQQPK